MLITTPVLRKLHSQGHEIVYVANERGVQILENNHHVSRLIEQKTDSVATYLLADHIEWLRKKHKCDRVIDFSESIEVALSQHPRSPNYKLPKYERFKRFNRNFYEYTFEWAGLDPFEREGTLLPELFFKDHEIDKAKSRLRDEKFNILIGMSGSGTNKTWPWTEALCGSIVQEIPDAHILTVGDYKCKLIEPEPHLQITCLSGEISMRESMALTSVVDLVISPDTGLLHASGCYSTPKIGLLGHNTIECITKHFKNDYSIEADSSKAECSPCFYLIYDKDLQCPKNKVTDSSVCMADGILPETVLDRVKQVYAQYKQRSLTTSV